MSAHIARVAFAVQHRAAVVVGVDGQALGDCNDVTPCGTAGGTAVDAARAHAHPTATTAAATDVASAAAVAERRTRVVALGACDTVLFGLQKKKKKVTITGTKDDGTPDE